MPEVEEVFRMATQKVRPDPGALERQNRAQRRRNNRRKAGVYVLVACLTLAVVLIAAERDDGRAHGPVAPHVTTQTPPRDPDVGFIVAVVQQVPGMPADSYATDPPPLVQRGA